LTALGISATILVHSITGCRRQSMPTGEIQGGL
jgi:hypothetical protein